MLLRLALFIILAFFIGRALWRLLDGIVEGASRGSRGSQVPQRGMAMARELKRLADAAPDGAASPADQ